MIGNQIVVLDKIKSQREPEVVKVGVRSFNVHFRVVTLCVITDEKNKTFGVGSAEWSPKDIFDYDRGCKLALSKALSKKNRLFRTTFWERWLATNRKNLENKINGALTHVSQLTKTLRSLTESVRHDIDRGKRGVFGCPKH